jgi:dihydroorotate dehydrogenase electron transfer subunit
MAIHDSSAAAGATCSTATGPWYADTASYVTARVASHRPIATNTWRLRVECPEIAAAATPGQFAMLRIPRRNDPLLARPLAVYDTFTDSAGGHDAAAERRYVDFLYAVHGRFTTALTEIAEGHDLVAWGPLGNGFAPPAVDHLVLVAGGIGQTALLALGRERLGDAAYGAPPRTAPRARRVTCCWGARHAGLFGGIDDFRAAGIEVHQATLDGSAGLRGTVVDLLDHVFTTESAGRTIPGAGTRIACCGPDPMMAAVAAWSAARGIGCDVSLEAPMACGIGICFTCVARVRDSAGGWDYRRTCIEGPVFDASRLVW